MRLRAVYCSAQPSRHAGDGTPERTEFPSPVVVVAWECAGPFEVDQGDHGLEDSFPSWGCCGGHVERGGVRDVCCGLWLVSPVSWIENSHQVQCVVLRPVRGEVVECTGRVLGLSQLESDCARVVCGGGVGCRVRDGPTVRVD